MNVSQLHPDEVRRRARARAVAIERLAARIFAAAVTAPTSPTTSTPTSGPARDGDDFEAIATTCFDAATAFVRVAEARLEANVTAAMTRRAADWGGP